MDSIGNLVLALNLCHKCVGVPPADDALFFFSFFPFRDFLFFAQTHLLLIQFFLNDLFFVQRRATLIDLIFVDMAGAMWERHFPALGLWQ
jgi:hypothetical protein